MRTFKTIAFLSILFFSFPSFAADVTLTWNANPPGDKVQGYIVYYTDGVDSWHNNAGNVTEYIVQNLTPGSSYDFHVRGYNVFGESLTWDIVQHDVPGYVPTENPKGEVIILLPQKVTITIQ